jgi:peptidoglycan/xylan/chitin deacetylase (PgdA/CDA1 family)
VSVSSVAKAAVCVAANFSGLSRAIALRYQGRGTIFALHSVVDDRADYLDQTLRCPVSKLEQVLTWLRKQGLEFVSLDTAVERLNGDTGRQFATFTFDDGFADNLTHALPIMERFGAPFTVYITTGMVTRGIDAWWFALDAWIRARQHISLPFCGRIECSDHATKKEVFQTIESAIRNEVGILSQVRFAMIKDGFECRTFVDRDALDKEQIGILAQHPLVTIGGHTTTHRNLRQLSWGEVESEMTANRRFLQELTGRAINHFAYPFGSPSACGPREAEIARSVGFRTAVTTRHGAMFPEHRQHLHALPRVYLACNDTPSTLRCKIDGVYHAVQSRLGNPVALM